MKASEDIPANGHGGPATPLSPSHKSALRARLRAARDGFVARGDHPPIEPPAALLERLRPGIVVASYWPIGSEADPVHLVRAAQVAGCHLALPHVTSRAEPIRFLGWSPALPLETGPFGLCQPVASAPLVNPDIVLVPLLGFDVQGQRLGQGAGHYDRALAALPDAWTLGVAWSVQQVDALAPDPWDVPLAAIVTERGLVTP